jgi:hypothetical protein
MMRRGRKERRSRDSEFQTVGALYEHFGNILPREIMITAVREALGAFVPRDESGVEETRLELVRKCEQALRRLAEAPEPVS